MTLSQQAPLVERLMECTWRENEAVSDTLTRWQREREEAAARITELETRLGGARGGEPVEHASDCQSHIVDVRGRPDECTCGALASPAEPSGWRPGVPAPEHLLEFIAYRPDAGAFPAQWHYPAHPDGGYDEEASPVLFTSGGMEDLTRDMPTMWHALPLPPTSEGGGHG